MRKYTDKNGLVVSLVKIEGSNDFHNLLEGGPGIIKKVRYLWSQKVMAEDGTFVHGMDELEESANSGDNASLPHCEIWTALLTAHRSFKDGVSSRSELNVYWYQEGEDPFKMLQNIISSISFDEYAKNVVWDDAS